MKNKVIGLCLSFLIVAILLLASCTTSSSATSSSATPSSTTPSSAISSSITTNATTKSVTTTTGNWWDSLGIPTYGGTMTLRLGGDISSFDPYLTAGISVKAAWMETLHADDWTLNPSIFDYHLDFRPTQYVKGNMAASWDFTDPGTFVVHLRKGIHWQDLPPANGREFIADDVVFHYDRMYGLGGGFTKPSPFNASSVSVFQDLISVTATDNYTVVFKWHTPNPEFIMETMLSIVPDQELENPDAVKMWGNLNDWHHAIGTGPFILTDFVSGASATLVKNQNYWGYDERYPQNKLPYVDTLKFLIIPDNATALAAFRTGKIDVVDQISLQNAQLMQKTNPKILQITIPQAAALSVDPRNDVAPFKDIKIREAMQMLIDLPTIAATYYGGITLPYPCTLTSIYEKGWGFPYDQWPQDLKNEYSYNPTMAKKLLADAGYPNGFNTNIVADNSGDMDLLQIVKSYFAQVGINMDIRTMDTVSWTTFVQVNRKQDQLAYRSASSLGATTDLIRQLQRFRTNYPANFLLVTDPVFDAFYTKAMAANSVDDVKQVMRDANEYVARQHLAISLLQPNLLALYQPWLKGYNGQDRLGMQSAGRGLLFFYTARFWIDLNLKNSMGH